MIYLKAKSKATGKVTICARYLDKELVEANKALVEARRRVNHNFLFLSKERLDHGNR